MLQSISRVSREKNNIPGLRKKAFRPPRVGEIGRRERTGNIVRVLDGKMRACLAWGLTFPCVGLILRQYQFMAILFLWFLVLSIGYDFVMIIPFGGLFIHGKGANIPVLRAVVFTVVLKCYCFPKTGLSSFYSAGRGGLKGLGGAVGGQPVVR